jgi:hypothetical protein
VCGTRADVHAVETVLEQPGVFANELLARFPPRNGPGTRAASELSHKQNIANCSMFAIAIDDLNIDVDGHRFRLIVPTIVAFGLHLEMIHADKVVARLVGETVIRDRIVDASETVGGLLANAQTVQIAESLTAQADPLMARGVHRKSPTRRYGGHPSAEIPVCPLAARKCGLRRKRRKHNANPGGAKDS